MFIEARVKQNKRLKNENEKEKRLCLVYQFHQTSKAELLRGSQKGNIALEFS